MNIGILFLSHTINDGGFDANLIRSEVNDTKHITTIPKENI